MRDTRVQKGLTLVELLLGTANDATDDVSLKQAQLRFTTLRVQELIRHCKLICSVSNDDFALWRADDNNDGHINIGEIVYIEWGSDRDHLQICEFPSSDGSDINIGSIDAVATNWWSSYSSSVEYTQVLPQCSNVQCGFDVAPPQSQFVSLTFNLTENNIPHQHQISRLGGKYA